MPSLSASALLLQLLLFSPSIAQPGFISLDCGGDDDYTDGIGIQWTSDAKFVSGGQKANLLLQSQLLQQQYTTVRSFPPDNNMYCYTVNVRNRTRYLVRATFLYGNFDNSSCYPKFDLFLGPTPWTTVVIDDATTPVVQEAIILAAASTLSVCLSNDYIGQRFISTLELRQFNGSLYYTTDEKQFFLRHSARINFGAESNASVRYPDDPFDRIWESDLVRRANYLVDVAPETERISTTKPIFVSTNEVPPQRVMQTAVVGKNGYLTYRIDLEYFPGNAWGVLYLAEIEDLAPNQTRKFKLVIPGKPEFSKPTVDVEENAQGKYRLYEPGYTNVPLPFVFSFGFKKTNDSSEGPILNAMEIYKYVKITTGSQDDAWTWRGRSSQKRIRIYVIAGISGLVGLCILLIFFIWHKKCYGMLLCQRASKNAPRIESFLQKQEALHPKRYTYSEVKRMTKSFAHKLGRGGFGTVYRGSLPDGREIAVKMLKDTRGDGEEFINEVASISRTSHINVVTLLGFSLQGSKRALVYEYMPNGSLDRYSFGDSSVQGDNTLSWDRLFDIIVGIARGLEYLHSHCNIRIVHFDIKPQNILLDQDFCPKISDFGLSKLCHLKESRISINGLRGTPGYIAPEVFARQYGSASSKSDVYSYGMVVLEMAGAKKNINISTDSSSKYFPQWLYDNLDQFCCPTGEISSQTTDLVKKMVIVGLWCIQLVPTDRPSMREVLEMLESNGRDLPLLPKGL